MTWRDLLQTDTYTEVMPWLGGRVVYGHGGARYTIQGRLAPEHGWYEFEIVGPRKAKIAHRDPREAPSNFGEHLVQGYLIGNRLVPDDARVDPDPRRLVDQTEIVYLYEPGLERFARVAAARHHDGNLIYLRQEFPLGPEPGVEEAFQDRLPDVMNIKDVTPALHLSFLWLTRQRDLEEERERERERLRLLEEQRQQALRNAGTGLGRRNLATRDFSAAARAALRVSGAELLDARPSRNAGEMVVQYRFRNQRFECVVHKNTLNIIDAGICLEDHFTGERGDTYFTLESLPGVVGEAIDLGVLHIWRHV